MARSINPETHAEKRNQILDGALRLVYTKGYEQMAIQDILDELAISKGAFYHYFDSKAALLDAIIGRMLDEALALLNPIVQHPDTPALIKLQRVFDSSMQWKTAHKAFMLELTRFWYADHNVLVRHKWLAISQKQTIQLIAQIFEQGIREGVFAIHFPDQAGMIFMSLMHGLGDAFAALLIAPNPQGDELKQAEVLVAAYNEAIERMLGAPTGSVHLMDMETLREWFLTSAKDLVDAGNVYEVIHA